MKMKFYQAPKSQFVIMEEVDVIASSVTLSYQRDGNANDDDMGVIDIERPDNL